MTFLDIDEEGVSITVSHYTDAGMKETVFDLRNLGDNSKQTLEINIEDVKQVKVTFPGSGAVTSIDFCYDPDDIPTAPPAVTAPPTAPPSKSPTPPPTSSPTNAPTSSPTTSPTKAPTASPTKSPTASPTASLTKAPTKAPSPVPSRAPQVPSIAPEPTRAPSALECTNVTIDFSTTANGDPLPGGAYVEEEWAEYGLTLSATGGFGSLPRLFNTSSIGSIEFGDPDLGAPNFRCDESGPGMGTGGEPGQSGENCAPRGNVLIIQENNTDTRIPDDNADGGMVVFEFEPPASFVYEMGFLDVDYETTIMVTYDDTEVTTIEVPILGDNSYQVVPINISNVNQIKVTIGRSGAITHISLCVGGSGPTTPEPAPTPSPAPTPDPVTDMSMSMSMSL